MDVVCDRCNTEYEFDDALVSERGTTVKCTSCGHQFKIYRPAAREEAPRSWNLRRPDGTVIPFDSLAVLQKWIVEGKVSKMDEISRPGEPWKPLGAIAELDSFFVTADQRAVSAAPRASQRPPSGKSPVATPVASVGRANTPAPGIARPPPPPAKGSLPPMTANPLRAPTPPMGSFSPSAKASLPPAGVNPVRAPTPPAVPQPSPPNRPASLRPEGPARPATVTSSAGLAIPPPPKLPSDLGAALDAAPRPDAQLAIDQRKDLVIGPPPRIEVDEEGPRARRDIRAQLPSDEEPTSSASPDELGLSSGPQRPRRWGAAVGLAVGLVVAVGAFFGARQAGLLGESAAITAAPTTQPVREEAARLARPGTVSGYESARTAVTNALVSTPDHPGLMALRASLDAAAAELERAQAETAPDAEATSLRRSADERLVRARADAETATANLSRLSGAERLEAEAELGDVARLRRDLATARGHAEPLRRESVRTVEADLFLALLARDSGDQAAALEGLRAVLTRADDLPRARLALVQLLTTQGDLLAARTELETVLRASPDHPLARALERGLQTPPSADAGAAVQVAQAPTPAPPPAAAPVAPVAAAPVAAAPVAAAPVAAAPVAAAPVAAPTPTPAAAARPASNEGAHLGYERLVTEADRLQNQGRSAQARERYLQALAAHPNGPEALVGLGNVALDQGDTAQAIGRFRQALSGNGRYADAYIGLGEAYGHARQYQQSLQAFRRYLEINPGGSHAGMAQRQIQALEERLRDVGASPSPGGN
ncbi:MAG: zinc-ribbon domain-containing protein [Myxococcales bacterium]|nr:zinc-ribbon domain-containing protein [Myxococcales bacterium]